jgi:hypothetical protein
MLPTHRIEQTRNADYCIVLPSGNYARDSNCEFWFTSDRDKADAALAYLVAGKPRTGAHWLKSTFGVC